MADILQDAAGAERIEAPDVVHNPAKIQFAEGVTWSGEGTRIIMTERSSMSRNYWLTLGSDSDIAALEDNYAQLLALLEKDNCAEEAAELDYEFHRLLGKATGNRLIARLYSYVMNFLHTSIRSSHVKNNSEAAKKVHKITIDAIKNRDMNLLEKIEQETMRSWISDADPLYFE